jgi:hypothetical protein
MDFVRVTLLAPIILWWLLNFLRIWALLVKTAGSSGCTYFDASVILGLKETGKGEN